MKKTLLVTVLAASLVLTACGAGNTNDKIEDEPSEATEVEEEEEETTESTEETTEREVETKPSEASGEETKPTNAAPVIGAPTGADSPEELINTILYAIKDDKPYTDVEYLFNWNGEVVEMTVYYTDIDMKMADIVPVIADIDKGADYIRANYPEFVDAFESQGDEFNDDVVAEIQQCCEEMNTGFTPFTEIPMEEYGIIPGTYPDDYRLVDVMFDNFKGYSMPNMEIDESGFWEDEARGIYSYQVVLNDKNDEYPIMIEIEYYEDNGKYFCYNLNEVWGNW